MVDNRQTWEAAALACASVNGSLANVTTATAGFLGSLFAYYKSSVTGATTAWGNRRVCAWVGLSNLGSNFSSFTGLTYTSELFWAEDAGAQCGAVSEVTTTVTLKLF